MKNRYRPSEEELRKPLGTQRPQEVRERSGAWSFEKQCREDDERFREAMRRAWQEGTGWRD